MLDTSESFVTSLARALNSNQVPCVLWGHCLLRVHGVPSIIGSIDFVIPDDRLGDGTKALAQVKSLSHCPDDEVCPSSSPERPTPPPAFHMHIGCSEVTVGLYLQSETLWFLPTLDSSLPAPERTELPPPFVLASDRCVLPPGRLSRGSGFFESEQDPVIVPRSHILLEAFLRLYVRNSEKRMGGFSMAMIAYMEEYVEDDGYLDANKLPEPLKKSYETLRKGDVPVRQWAQELREALAIPAAPENHQS